jgi:hypothetical protein
MRETSERPWVKGDRFTILGEPDHVYEVRKVGPWGVTYRRDSGCNYAPFEAMRRVDPPEPVGELLEMEHDGKRWREVLRERYDDGELNIRFEPVPLNLDDLARIGWEARNEAQAGGGTRWDDCSEITQRLQRVNTAAVLDAVGHVLPEQEEGPR